MDHWLHRCPNLDVRRQRTIGSPSLPLGVLTTELEKNLALGRATLKSRRRPPLQQRKSGKMLGEMWSYDFNTAHCLRAFYAFLFPFWRMI